MVYKSWHWEIQPLPHLNQTELGTERLLPQNGHRQCSNISNPQRKIPPRAPNLPPDPQAAAYWGESSMRAAPGYQAPSVRSAIKSYSVWICFLFHDYCFGFWDGSWKWVFRVFKDVKQACFWPFWRLLWV